MEIIKYERKGCAPCFRLGIAIEEAGLKDKVTIEDVTDASGDELGDLNLQGVPTLRFFNSDKKLLHEIVGFRSADELKAIYNELNGGNTID